MAKVSLTLGDCMDAMREMPDNSYQLAIVDPPYGGGRNADAADTFSAKRGRFGQRFDRYFEIDTRGGRFDRYKSEVQDWQDGRHMGGEIQLGGGDHDIRHWDVAPSAEYFNELFRVSENQIIWGGNYFRLPENRCFIVWRKTNIPLRGFTMAPCEYAWTSFNRNAEMFEFSSAGKAGNPRFHPTQKPVELYEWCLSEFANKGDRILDTHAGSGSLEVACVRMGFDCDGWEINKTYHGMASERIDREQMQGRLF